MHARGTFTVDSSVPVALPDDLITAGLTTGVLVFAKTYTGDIEGRSSTIFTSAYDPATGVGTYVALETVDGTVGGHAGCFTFLHSASTTGADRTAETFRIVPSSGTGHLAGISGDGGLAIDDDGTHRIWLDYEIDERT
jgi:hypothetical protein